MDSAESSEIPPVTYRLEEVVDPDSGNRDRAESAFIEIFFGDDALLVHKSWLGENPCDQVGTGSEEFETKVVEDGNVGVGIAELMECEGDVTFFRVRVLHHHCLSRLLQLVLDDVTSSLSNGDQSLSFFLDGGSIIPSETSAHGAA